jgi:hypothetical protein
MARFHVRDTFALNDRSAFVLAGFVIEGDVSRGMAVRMPFRPDVMVTATIGHVESLQRPDGNVVCLCIRCAAPQETALWESLGIKDRIVEVIPAG